MKNAKDMAEMIHSAIEDEDAANREDNVRDDAVLVDRVDEVELPGDGTTGRVIAWMANGAVYEITVVQLATPGS